VSTEQVAPTIGHMLVLKQLPPAPWSQVPAKSGQKTVTLLHDACPAPEHWPPVGRHSPSLWHTLPIGPVQWPAIPQLPGVQAEKSIVQTPPRSGHSVFVPTLVQALPLPLHRAD
jgi:hypothetical protein